jgi:fructose-1,6-bisphosphatase
LTDGVNAFGDKQLDLDILCDNAICAALKETGLVSHVLSEEKPYVQEFMFNL